MERPNPWVRVGGTSLSAPAWAALIAIADQSRASIGLGSLDGATQTLPMIYASSSDFNDITVGNNGYSRRPGYDLVTGLGTPKAVPLVHDLVGPFLVAASTPANGSTVSSAPTDFAITFGSPYATTGIVAGDLTVNGIAADSFTQTSSTTITFHYNASPVTTQGLQTMSIAAGVLTRQADGAPLAAFSATFRYDALPIAIDATTPVNGSIVTLPLTSLNVHFNEAFAAATIGTSNLTLSQGTVTGFTLVDSQTVQYTLSGVNSPGTLTINMAAGAVTDPFGNAGPAYSGNSVPQRHGHGVSDAAGASQSGRLAHLSKQHQRLDPIRGKHSVLYAGRCRRPDAVDRGHSSPWVAAADRSHWARSRIRSPRQRLPARRSSCKRFPSVRLEHTPSRSAV